MALRAQNELSSSTIQSSLLSHLVGLPVFWHDANSSPTMEWDKCVDLFQVAVLARYSISLTELTRDASQQNPRVRALMGDLEEEPANNNVVSVLYLSLGEAARKQFRDKFPHVTLWSFKVNELTKMCNECFWKKRNRTLDWHKFLFQNATNRRNPFPVLVCVERAGSPMRFRRDSTTLVLDMLIHKTNKKVQEKLCTEPKEPEQALNLRSFSRKG